MRKTLLDSALETAHVLDVISAINQRTQVTNAAQARSRALEDLSSTIRDLNAQADAAGSPEERQQILSEGGRLVAEKTFRATGKHPTHQEVETALGVPSIERSKFLNEQQQQAGIKARLQDLIQSTQHPVLFQDVPPSGTNDPTRVQSSLTEPPPGATRTLGVGIPDLLSAIGREPALAEFLKKNDVLPLFPGTGAIGGMRLNELRAAAQVPPGQFVTGGVKGVTPELTFKPPESLEQVQAQAIDARGGTPTDRQVQALRAGNSVAQMQTAVNQGLERVQALRTQIVGGKNALGIDIPEFQGDKTPLVTDLIGLADSVQQQADALSAATGTPSRPLFPGLLPDRQEIEQVNSALEQQTGQKQTPQSILSEIARRRLHGSKTPLSAPSSSASPPSGGIVDSVKQFLGLGGP